jgi:hypothetical protein
VKQHGYSTQVERHTPDLDTIQPDGSNTRAIMDIVATQDTQVYYIDVTVTSPLTTETVTRDQLPTTKNPYKEGNKTREENTTTTHISNPSFYPHTEN